MVCIGKRPRQVDQFVTVAWLGQLVTIDAADIAFGRNSRPLPPDQDRIAVT